MSPTGDRHERPRVAIIGGGLAGLAAAVGLADDCHVTLCEARRQLGGRAASFKDNESGQLIDFCQHVSMGCCTNLADFAERTGIARHFKRLSRLHFIGPDGRRYDLAAMPRLPAPLHLLPALTRMGFLSLRDRLRIGQAVWRLLRLTSEQASRGGNMADWLREHRQSQAACDFFWSVVLVSALGETLEHSSLSAARQVFVEGFAAARTAYEVLVPQLPLSELLDGEAGALLESHHVDVRRSTAIESLHRRDHGFELVTSGHANQPLVGDAVIVAVPWRAAGDLLTSFASELPWLATINQLKPSPITGVHLWFDRPIMPLSHAVLVGRASQWVFKPAPGDNAGEHYYQVVISASSSVAPRDRDELIDLVCRELGETWPEAKAAKLLRSRVVTEPAAVFSPQPDIQALRPQQETAVPGLAVAGDWTNTSWPATMEGAVRSGYLAAEAVGRFLGRPRHLLQPGLERGWLARLLVRL